MSQRKVFIAVDSELTKARRRKCIRVATASVFSLIALIGLVGFTVLVVYCSLKGETLLEIQGVASYVRENLAGAPIFDLHVSFYNTCPENYSIVRLYRWPGTDQGCYCANNEDYWDIRKGYCSSSRGRFADAKNSFNLQGCYDIGSIEHRLLSNWKNNVFCARYYEPDDYDHTAGACRKDFRKCTNDLCVHEMYACPITSVEIVKKIQTPDLIFTSAKVLADGRYLMVNRKFDEQPIYSFEVSIADLPCLASNLKPSQYKFNEYPLLKSIVPACNKYGLDNNSKIIDKDSETNFYEGNLMYRQLGNLPGYVEYISNRTALFTQRPKLSLRTDEKCYSIQPENFTKFNESFLKFRQLVLGFGVIGLLICLIMLLLIVSFLLKDDYDFSEFGRRLKWVELTPYMIVVVIILFLFIFAGLYAEGMKKQYEFLDGLHRNSCLTNKDVQIALADSKMLPDQSMHLFVFLKLFLFIVLVCIATLISGNYVKNL